MPNQIQTPNHPIPSPQPQSGPARSAEAAERATDGAQAWWILMANTIAFAVCFAAWMMNGPLVTFLVDKGLFNWNRTQTGLLIAVPVLTGAVMRLPVGILCDRFGGRIVFFCLILVTAVPMYLVAYAHSFGGFVLAGLGFDEAGASFAAGVAYT